MPISWTLPATKEADIYDFGKGTLPRVLFSNGREEEEFRAFQKIFYLACLAFDDWGRMTYILEADGIWLDQHAKDRGTFRQQNESNATLRERLRTYEDAVTRPSILAAMQAVVDNFSASWTQNMIELKRDRAYLRERTSPSGTGDTFAKSGSTVTLTDAGFTFNGNEVGRTVTITGATSSGNNGTFTITGVTNNSISWTNASGVAETFPGTWKIDANLDGRLDAYLSRGYRMGATHVGRIISIIPYGSTAALQAALKEAVRVRKAGGIGNDVERRLNP